MKKLFAMLVFGLLQLSCRKHTDKPGDPAPPKLLRIKTINTNTFSYDNLGRITKAIYGNGIPYSTVYTYSKTAVKTADFYQDGSPRQSGTSIFTLASDGLATSDHYFLDPSAPFLVVSFTYNSIRQLMEETGADESGSASWRTVYYYSNGNMDSLKTYSPTTGMLLTREYFEYYVDTKNTLTNEFNGISFLGAGNVNLLKKHTRVDSNTGSVDDEYMYEFDDQMRAVRSVHTSNGAVIGDLHYTYVML